MKTTNRILASLLAAALSGTVMTACQKEDRGAGEENTPQQGSGTGQDQSQDQGTGLGDQGTGTGGGLTPEGGVDSSRPGYHAQPGYDTTMGQGSGTGGTGTGGTGTLGIDTLGLDTSTMNRDTMNPGGSGIGY